MLKKPIPSERSASLAVSFSPDGSRLVSNSADGTSRIWDVESGAQRPLLGGFCHAWSKDGSKLIVFRDGRHMLIDAATGELIDAATGEVVQEFTQVDESYGGRTRFRLDDQYVVAGTSRRNALSNVACWSN